MRTPHLLTFCSSISAINNHFSHAAFIFEQFSLDNKDRVKRHPNKLTKEVYSQNEYALQFNVKLSNLETQALASKNFITDSLFVFANTYFEVYLKDLFFFYQTLTGEKLGELPERSIFSNVLGKLGINADSDLNNLTLSTFEYLKLRRNAVMHRDRSKYFQGSFVDLIKGTFGKSNNNHSFRAKQLNGSQLNAEWKKHRENTGKGYTIHSFNFHNSKQADISFEELCDILNFFRLFAAEIDRLVLGKVDRGKLIAYCMAQYKIFYKDKGTETSHEKFSIKFKRNCIFALGFEPSEEEVEENFKGA